MLAFAAARHAAFRLGIILDPVGIGDAVKHTPPQSANFKRIRFPRKGL